MKDKPPRPRVHPRSAVAIVAEESDNHFNTEVQLHELRQSKALSQVVLAKTLNVHQAAISKMEHRNDMYVSTLREYIRALGGHLEIGARFPDGAVKISNFNDPAVVHTVQEATAELAPSYGVALL
jgi:predicted transcriptional regulator